MSPPEAVRYAALGVGGLQLLANAGALLRGPGRIRAELATGALSERFADLLSVAWVYGTVANLCIAALLLLMAGPLRERSAVGWRVTAAIGVYYVAVGATTYLLGIRRHPGLLVFVAFGLALLVPLFIARRHFAL
jgi:hypothetical protein